MTDKKLALYHRPTSSAEATAYMNAYKVYKLDRDKDGIACESN
ncbi:excalibur calcium-binding domain-containing protein [Baia soyae]